MLTGQQQQQQQLGTPAQLQALRAQRARQEQQSQQGLGGPRPRGPPPPGFFNPGELHKPEQSCLPTMHTSSHGLFGDAAAGAGSALLVLLPLLLMTATFAAHIHRVPDGLSAQYMHNICGGQMAWYGAMTATQLPIGQLGLHALCTVLARASLRLQMQECQAWLR